MSASAPGKSRNPFNRIYPPETVEQAYQLWKARNPLKTIAEKTGIPMGTLGTWPKRHHWHGRMLAEKSTGRDMSKLPEETKKLDEAMVLAEMLKQKDASDDEALDDAMLKGMTREELAAVYIERMARLAMRVPKMLLKMPDASILQAADKIAKLDAVAREALGIKDKGAAPAVNIAFISQGMVPARISVQQEPQPALVDVEVLESGEGGGEQETGYSEAPSAGAVGSGE